MKVVLFNGSRREDGCTYTALNLVAEELKNSGIEAEIMNVGKRIFNGELTQVVAEAAEKVKAGDGFVFGSPVYWASPTGEIVSFMDRLWGTCGQALKYKPAAAVSSARRAGTTATIDVINKYFAYSSMPIVSSCYWNEVHGKNPADVLKDEEGVQIMRTLGRNMAWILKSIEAGKKAGIEKPAEEDKIFTNYIK